MGKPSSEYRRYQQSFLWIADLAKHVVDYLHLNITVDLSHFRDGFCAWLRTIHGFDKDLAQWLRLYNRTDFRSAIVAHANFLYCQAAQVDIKLTEQPIWAEIDTRDLSAVPEQTEKNVAAEMTVRVNTGNSWNMQRKTTVTPYASRCFANLPWATFLHSSQSMTSSPSVLNGTAQATSRDPLRRPIKVGDVVAVDSHGERLWKTEDTEYYAYVQDVKVTTLGRSLGLLWFYRPWDTACKKMRYPFEKELFLSDHCNCGDADIYERDVTYLPKVTFFGRPDSPGCDFFCRQQYIQGDNEWRTLQETSFHCRCKNRPPKLEFKTGDTLLVKKRSGNGMNTLEPVILIEPASEESDDRMKVRRLLRKGRDYDCPNAAPNELVYTDQLEIMHASTIERRCQIRFVTEHEKQHDQIPHPYNKRGPGDFFFITTQESFRHLQFSKRECILKPLSHPWPTPMKQGWLPEHDTTGLHRLRGLDIFCGGGNFGRGLEEGGAVEFEWAVDYYNEAIHTYKANLQNPKKTKLFRGSVNHYLSQAMDGKGIGLVAQKGEVEFISSGSPCQGSSLLNPQRGIHDRGLLNESLIASAVSFIDFYRPKYALLENVLGLASGGDSHNVLAQVICALVGIGYQVKSFVLDAWNFGSPQSRSRVFISCAAAGLKPLEEPPHTHSHPRWVRGSSLGRTANGLSISSRYKTPTPFEYMTAGEAVKDLPETNGRTNCIPFPDHRTSVQLSTLDLIRLESIPRCPAGMSFVKAVERGYMPQAQVDSFSWHSSVRGRNGSRSWQRIQRNALMPTVTTAIRPTDGVAGACLHWDQHRVLTIMEVRRAQGFPDDEVIIGERSHQYRIVGNSVARPVAFALGMSLRTAWVTSLEQAAASYPPKGIMGSDIMTLHVSIDQPSDLITKSNFNVQIAREVNRTHFPSTLQVVVPLRSSITAQPPNSKTGQKGTVKDKDVNRNSHIQAHLPTSTSQPENRVNLQPRTGNGPRPSTPTATSPSLQRLPGNSSGPTTSPALGPSIAEFMNCHDERSATISNMGGQDSNSPKKTSPLTIHSGRRNSWAIRSPITSPPIRNESCTSFRKAFDIASSELGIRQTTAPS